MRFKFVIILAVFFFALSEVTVAIENPSISNPSVKNPAGSGTVPPSSYRGGLVDSPNPIDRSGNLVVTGNVGGGKHFRGFVPYNAVTDFGGSLGSSTVNSFLRRSFDPAGSGYYTGKVVPYYSQRGTVTTTIPGRAKVFSPPITNIKGPVGQGITMRRAQELPEADSGVYDFRFRPMSATAKELEKVIAIDTEKQRRAKELAAEKYQEQMKQFQQDLERVSDGAAELEQKLTVKEERLGLPAKPEAGEDMPQVFESQEPEEEIGKDKQIDIFERMKQQVGDLQNVFEPQIERREEQEASDKEKKAGKDEGRISTGRKLEAEEGFREKNLRRRDSVLEGLTEKELAIKAETILGEHKTFASFSNDKFNRHLRAGEDYLEQGKYYRAADAYTLASIYKPSDPLAYAGKSHALFAAGEYMSSALFLSRALEIFPEYTRFKIDIEGMLGDRDNLESRVADVEQWQKVNDSGELQFLLADIYHQMGREENAKRAIVSAYEKMPESAAVLALKKTINSQ